MYTWYPFSNMTPADDNSLQAWDYTSLVDGDKAIGVYNEILHHMTWDENSALTEDIPNVVNPDGNAGNGRWIRREFDAIRDRNGIEDASLTTLSFVDGTRTLSIQPIVSTFKFFVEGKSYISTGDTVVITDVEGIHWVYFDNDGDLKVQAPGGSTDALILTKCLVAAIHWDATNNTGIRVGNERHGSSMSPVTHYHFHEVFGAKWDSGGSLGDFDMGGTGTDANAQFSVSAAEMHDEDLEIDVSHGDPQNINLPAEIPVLYKDGASGVWRKTTANTFPVTAVGGTIVWNEWTGAVWQLTAAANNRYVLYHYFMDNDISEPIFAIPGQATYLTLNAAQEAAEAELLSLNLAGLPGPEIVALGTVIFKCQTAAANAVNAVTVVTADGDDYIDWRQTNIIASGGSTGNHETLSGLLGGAAGDHYHLTGAQHDTLTDGSDATGLHEHNTLTNGDDSISLAGDEIQIISDTIELQLSSDNGEAHLTDGAGNSLTLSSDDDEAVIDAATTMLVKVASTEKISTTADGTQLGASGARVTTILDEDDMASDSATALATQQSVKAYIDDATVRKGRNLIINGAMQVAQRGVSFAGLTDQAFTLDRWRWDDDGTTSAVVTVTQDDTDLPAGETFGSAIKIDVTTAEAGGDASEWLGISNAIEAKDLQHLRYGSADAQDLTVSFLFKSDTKTGTFSLALSQQDAVKVYISEITVSDNNWNKYTVTIPGNQSDAINNDNGQGLKLWFIFQAGSSFQTSSIDTWGAMPNWASDNQDNFLDSDSNNLWLTGVQLEVGSAATEFDHRPYSEELRLCMRYYERWDSRGTNDTLIGSAYCYSATSVLGTVHFLVAKCDAGITLSYGTIGNILFHSQPTGFLALSAVVVSDPSLYGCRLTCTVAGGTVNSAGRLEFDTTCFLAFECEI